MKFAKHIAKAMVVSDPEWSPFWINYKQLKRLMKRPARLSRPPGLAASDVADEPAAGASTVTSADENSGTATRESIAKKSQTANKVDGREQCCCHHRQQQQQSLAHSANSAAAGDHDSHPRSDKGRTSLMRRRRPWESSLNAHRHAGKRTMSLASAPHSTRASTSVLAPARNQTRTAPPPPSKSKSDARDSPAATAAGAFEQGGGEARAATDSNGNCSAGNVRPHMKPPEDYSPGPMSASPPLGSCRDYGRDGGSEGSDRVGFGSSLEGDRHNNPYTGYDQSSRQSAAVASSIITSGAVLSERAVSVGTKNCGNRDEKSNYGIKGNGQFDRSRRTFDSSMCESTGVDAFDVSSSGNKRKETARPPRLPPPAVTAAPSVTGLEQTEAPNTAYFSLHEGSTSGLTQEEQDRKQQERAHASHVEMPSPGAEGTPAISGKEEKTTPSSCACSCVCPFFSVLLKEIEACRVFFLENEADLQVRHRMNAVLWRTSFACVTPISSTLDRFFLPETGLVRLFGQDK